jgi:hypothetical protein
MILTVWHKKRDYLEEFLTIIQGAVVQILHILVIRDIDILEMLFITTYNEVAPRIM